MNTNVHPIDQAADLLGGRAAMADLLGVTPAALGNWKARSVPIEHCPEIDRLTGGVVSRKVLRPNDWWRIWPEIVDPSPNQPQTPANQARAAINSDDAQEAAHA